MSQIWGKTVFRIQTNTKGVMWPEIANTWYPREISIRTHVTERDLGLVLDLADNFTKSGIALKEEAKRQPKDAKTAWAMF